MREIFPFEEALQPFVAEARRELRIRAGAAWLLLAESALENLETSLLRLLASLLGQALELRFSLFRHYASPDAADLYENFVSGVASAGLLKVLADYPVFETLIDNVITDWIDCYSQLLRRLASDLPEIRIALGNGQRMRKVSGIQADLSDRHNGGRTAAILRFTDAPPLVYKSKNCDSDEAFYLVLRWLAERGAPADFFLPAMVLRPDYGWSQFIPQQPCASQEKVRSYFLRAGALLFAVYLLCGSDCHFDNLIACGAYPVLVDTETFFQPLVRPPNGASQSSYTVFSTGLLPGIPVAGCDASAFGAVKPQSFAARIPRWTGTNTRAMELHFVEASLLPQLNVPMFEGKACQISSYAAEFLNGFEETYRTALRHRSDLLASAGPLQRIEGCEIRFLLRGTLDYYFAVNRALHLRNLRGAHELAIELAELPVRRTVFQALVPLELAALRRLDIPRFITTTTSGSLAGAGITISGCFSQTGYTRVMERVSNLGEEDLVRQIALIRISLA